MCNLITAKREPGEEVERGGVVGGRDGTLNSPGEGLHQLSNRQRQMHSEP